ncbi:MAG: hypothetical protein R3E97_05575 [Candidatus Eisenbacteria bacterium]
MRITIFQIKFLHTLICFALSFCVLFVLFAGVANRVTSWTWAAAGALLVESLVLAAFRGTCPLTILAERQGAERGAVTDIFLPRWMADQIFPVCGTAYVVGVALVIWRMCQR